MKRERRWVRAIRRMLAQWVLWRRGSAGWPGGRGAEHEFVSRIVARPTTVNGGLKEYAVGPSQDIAFRGAWKRLWAFSEKGYPYEAVIAL